MLRNLSTACARCKTATEHVQHVSKRSRSGIATKSSWSNRDKPRQPPSGGPPTGRPPTGRRPPLAANFPSIRRVSSPFFAPLPNKAKSAPPETLTPETCGDYFESSVEQWCTNLRTLQRFKRFGFASGDIQPILDTYAQTGLSGFFSTPANQTKYQLTRFADHVSLKPMARQVEAEVIFSNIFFSWCHNTEDSAILDEQAAQGKINAKTLAALRHLAEVSQRRPAEEFPYARKMKRKFIMHVGPTNSGKTHHALRALAAAKTGVYAGPLRLLAHEIWERLNLGQIVPLGVDQPPPNIDPPPTITTAAAADTINAAALADPSIAPQAQKLHNPTYARATNMITGEEKKIVSEFAGLLTCTVEMLSFRAQYDVGVIDEIQMIGDAQRGFAWTAAVLGLCAHEIHLCGEESAIGVVRALLEETGDELEVRRYERLTPLSVEERSLGGNYSKVMKGDCVVAFSRTRIFEIKEEIERRSGLRCAVVYGKLPPEIRSEQAALFNDPNSGFDVIIGSDAIGMGLNLKIRRIIFDAVAKVDGSNRIIPLSVSQTKQIAGRAGRYGHTLTGSKPGGYTTTLHHKDLPFLHTALSHPSTPTLTHAHIGPSASTCSKIVTGLPPSTSLESVQMAHVYVSPLPRVYKYGLESRVAEVCGWVDEKSKGHLTWGEKQVFLVSPVAWRDGIVVKAVEEMVRMQRDEMCVDIDRVLGSGGLGFFDALGQAERQMAKAQGIQHQGRGERKGERNTAVELKDTILELLESFHKILVLYMWMHFRNCVIYPDQVKAEDLKHRVEVVMDWALQQMGKGNVMRRWGKTTQHRHHPSQSPVRSRITDELSSLPPTMTAPPPRDQPRSRVDYTSKTEAAQYTRRWEQPPDLSTLLKKYVDSPRLKASGGRSG